MLLLLPARVPPKARDAGLGVGGNAQPGQPGIPTVSLVGRGGSDHLRAWSTPAAWAGQCWSTRIPLWAPCTTSILPGTGGTGSGATLARGMPGHGAHQVRSSSPARASASLPAEQGHRCRQPQAPCSRASPGSGIWPKQMGELHKQASTGSEHLPSLHTLGGAEPWGQGCSGWGVQPQH